ncbi:MAG: serine/threonine protein phosphatase [Proteobacteria bacterium]|nr:serine/threonine protein phosphatase [Pseudomonadota bacterium]
MTGAAPAIRIEVVEAPGTLGYPAGPDGTGVYAIGDIHGRDDLLAALLAAIRADGAANPRNLLICLGDYVDRGPASAAVVERLSRFHAEDFTLVPLLGNHEDLMLRFLADPDEGGPWLANGGAATLASYGVEVGPGWPERFRYEALRDALARALPARHRRFLDTLATRHAVGDYLFVHAGIRPGIALDRQDAHDLIWIRGPFLRATEPLGALVVHGHSIAPAPELKANRIGIDTGAFGTGRLTALAITGARVRLVTAAGAVDRSYVGL